MEPLPYFHPGSGLFFYFFIGLKVSRLGAFFLGPLPPEQIREFGPPGEMPAGVRSEYLHYRL